MTAGDPRHPQDAIDFKLLRHVHARALPYVPFSARQEVADFIVEKINGLIGRPPPAPAAHMELEREGLLRLGSLMAPQQVADVVAYLKDFRVFDGHMLMQSDRVPKDWGELARTAHYAAYQRGVIVRAPHLLGIANRPEIVALAAAKLGCWPTLYSLHAWWSFGGRPMPARYAQAFHRDVDDHRFCTLFIYLTDVDAARGPHQFIRSSHRVEGLREMLTRAANRDPSIDPNEAETLITAGYGLDDVYERLFGENIETITGAAGDAFLADTSGLHRGLPPRAGNRLILWARYGLLPNSGVDEDWFEPVPRSELTCELPDDALTRYINRALVR
jgi:hypothetical protein